MATAISEIMQIISLVSDLFICFKPNINPFLRYLFATLILKRNGYALSRYFRIFFLLAVGIFLLPMLALMSNAQTNSENPSIPPDGLQSNECEINPGGGTTCFTSSTIPSLANQSMSPPYTYYFYNPSGTPSPYVGGRSNADTSAVGALDVWDHCRYVDNTTSNSLFVPFRVQKEWDAFVGNYLTNMADDQAMTCAKAWTGESGGLEFGPTSFIAAGSGGGDGPDSGTSGTASSNVAPVQLPYARTGTPYPPGGDQYINNFYYQCNGGYSAYYCYNWVLVPQTCTSCSGSGASQVCTSYDCSYYVCTIPGTACNTSPYSWTEQWQFTSATAGNYEVSSTANGWTGGSSSCIAGSDRPAACYQYCQMSGPYTCSCESAPVPAANCPGTAVAPVASCGSLAGTTVTTAISSSTAGLCAAGSTLAAVSGPYLNTGTTTYSWNCTNGTDVKACYATAAATAGACGAANGQSFASAPTDPEQLCSSGTPDSIPSGSGPTWSWTCLGIFGAGNSPPCQASESSYLSEACITTPSFSSPYETHCPTNSCMVDAGQIPFGIPNSYYGGQEIGGPDPNDWQYSIAGPGSYPDAYGSYSNPGPFQGNGTGDPFGNRVGGVNGLAIGQDTELIVYEGLNFSGPVIWDVHGPLLVQNTYAGGNEAEYRALDFSGQPAIYQQFTPSTRFDSDDPQIGLGNYGVIPEGNLLSIGGDTSNSPSSPFPTSITVICH